MKKTSVPFGIYIGVLLVVCLLSTGFSACRPIKYTDEVFEIEHAPTEEEVATKVQKSMAERAKYKNITKPYFMMDMDRGYVGVFDAGKEQVAMLKVTFSDLIASNLKTGDYYLSRIGGILIVTISSDEGDGKTYDTTGVEMIIRIEIPDDQYSAIASVIEDANADPGYIYPLTVYSPSEEEAGREAFKASILAQ